MPGKKRAVLDRAKKIWAILHEDYPAAECALHFRQPLDLLVATILSAQCTDERVNQVTKSLFKTYRSARDYANADIGELEDAVRSTGFFRNKAKNIQAMAQVLLANFNGEVPKTLDELVTLPGVGRKTANVVLGNAFGVPGITVDTHLGRLSRRMGFTEHDDPVKVEFDLMDLIPREDWTHFSHAMIWHGRRVCASRKPNCAACRIGSLCPSYLVA
ncbi:MAG: endonuclease III [Deltaproteobacteria bacterium]|nr:endonuclease III [Deltaproteobacteria bacterium]